MEGKKRYDMLEHLLQAISPTYESKRTAMLLEKLGALAVLEESADPFDDSAAVGVEPAEGSGVERD